MTHRSVSLAPSNQVGIGDYYRQVAAWYQADSTADIGDRGLVDLEDCFLLSKHRREQGDPE